MKILDVNVLLYACNAESEHHDVVRSWLEAAMNGHESIGMSWPVIVGFLRMSTHPAIFERPLSSETALAQVEEWLSVPVVSLVTEKREHWQVLRELVGDLRAINNLIPDAHLAALALTHGATLVSFDRNFGRFPELRWEVPAAGNAQ